MPAARDSVMEFVRQYCSGEPEEIDILLALHEALANAVLHGCQNDASKTIHCRVEVDPSALTIVISDPGPGFDPQAATQSTEAGTNTTQSGRGICMMRSLMDEVSYRNGGSEVRLRKLRRVPEPINI